MTAFTDMGASGGLSPWNETWSLQAGAFPEVRDEDGRKFGKGDAHHRTRRTEDGQLGKGRPEEHHDGKFKEGDLTYFTSPRVGAGEQDVDTHGSHLEVGFKLMYVHNLKKKDF